MMHGAASASPLSARPMSQKIPSKASPRRAGRLRAGNFLRTLRVDHGPIELLGRFFLKAEMAARKRGLDLSFASFEELAAVNLANRQHWAPLLPQFRPGMPGLGEDTAFCILGRNAAGEVVATQAARFYDLSASNLQHESESLRLFYGSGPTPPDATCRIRTPVARSIRGYVAYSGSGWYRPDYRGLQLSAILPRISRAYALARWNTQTTVSFINVGLVQKGIAARYGYTRLDGEVRLRNVFAADFKGVVAWMPRDELVSDIRHFLRTFDAQIDIATEARGGDEQPLPARARER
jgi:hypothetical protein